MQVLQVADREEVEAVADTPEPCTGILYMPLPLANVWSMYTHVYTFKSFVEIYFRG